MRRDALLLIGHGSARYPDAGRPLLAHADAIREENHFAEVATGFLNGAPSVADALAALRAPKIHVVPFFMEDGYFTQVAVPKILAAHGSRDIQLHAPVGTQAAMAATIEARVRRDVAIDPALLALVLIGHGSGRNPGQPMALHRHAATLGEGKRFGSVQVAFLEEPPSVENVLAALRGHPVAVLGCFANDGKHVRDDLPRLIAAEQAIRGARSPPLHGLGTIADDIGMRGLILRLLAT